MAGIDSYTKLMLHCDGDDGSTSFPDASAGNHTVTAGGHAQVDTAQKKFGTGSLLLDGNSDDIIYTPDSDDFSLGSGDFTIDFWLRLNSVPTSFTGMVSKWDLSANREYEFVFSSSTALSFYYSTDGNTPLNLPSWTISSPSTGTWYHYALVRYGNDFTFYIDGVSKGTRTESFTFFNGTARFDIGRSNHDLVPSINGWIDEFRFSKGIARWTSNFTPPTEEYKTANGNFFQLFK